MTDVERRDCEECDKAAYGVQEEGILGNVMAVPGGMTVIFR